MKMKEEEYGKAVEEREKLLREEPVRFHELTEEEIRELREQGRI